jgi:hypothetical protein
MNWTQFSSEHSKGLPKRFMNVVCERDARYGNRIYMKGSENGDHGEPSLLGDSREMGSVVAFSRYRF